MEVTQSNEVIQSIDAEAIRGYEYYQDELYLTSVIYDFFAFIKLEFHLNPPTE